MMRSLPDNSIDALISDPPYATTNFEWDKPVDWALFWQEADRVCKPTANVALFAQPGRMVATLISSNPKAFRYWLVWEKPLATGFLDCNKRPMRCHEMILLFCRQFRGKGNTLLSIYNPQKTPGKPYKARRGGSCNHYGQHRSSNTDNKGDRYPRDVLKFKNVSKAFFNSEEAFHPTQKPLDLMQWLILSYTQSGGVILDPFAGSGSTGVACLQADRNFVGIERDENYHAIASKRIRKVQEVPIARRTSPTDSGKQ